MSVSAPDASNAGDGGRILRNTVMAIVLLSKVAHFIFRQLWILESFCSCAIIFYFHSLCLLILVLPSGRMVLIHLKPDMVALVK